MILTIYIIYGLVFIFTSQWAQIKLWSSSLGQKKHPITIIKNSKIQKLIRNKTGINIGTIKILESNRLFAMMIGIPTKPQLIISRNLYETFSPDELEYVVLHEVAHYKFWHTVIELTVEILLFVIGVFILNKFSHSYLSIPSAIILGLIFGVIMIRLGRIHEYQADNYARKHMTNPKGMIDATNKFRGYYGKNFTGNNHKIIEFLFYRGNPYDNRIAMAQKEITERMNQ